jgi:hypothetical protein
MMIRLANTFLAATGMLFVPISLGAQGVTPWSMLTRSRTYSARPTVAEISAADLMTRVFLFADDSMNGRRLATEENMKAVEYIASEVKRLGLEPGGESGTFFQTVPVFDRVLESGSVAVNGSTLTPWTDFAPRDQGSRARSVSGVPVVYGGSWGEEASLLLPDSAIGKLVVLGVAGRGPGGPSDGLPNRPSVYSRYIKAAGIAVVALERISPASMAQYQQPNQLFRGDASPPDLPLPSYFYITRRVATLILGTPIESARTGMAGAPLSGSPRFIDQPPRYPARNVVALLRGSDPAHRGQYVAMGAHNDHVDYDSAPVAHDSIYALNHLFRRGGADDPTPRPTAEQTVQLNATIAEVRKLTGGESARLDSIYNGADDDASGSMGVLEIAEWFSSLPITPKRSLLFVWHVGEEEGLYGSAHFADHPTVPRDSIVAQLNMDMIGRGGATEVTGNSRTGGRLLGGPNYLQLIGARRLSDELGDLADSVNLSGGHRLQFDFEMDADGHPQNIYCRSDHYEYARHGIPIIFFTTGGHADYHQLTDEPQYIDYDRLARVSRFVADLAARVANLDHRVVVNKPKPDPNGECRQ